MGYVAISFHWRQAMGTVTKRGESWRAMVRKVGHKPHHKTFKSAKAAKEWIADMEREMRHNRVIDPHIQIDKLISKYVEDIAPKRKLAPSHLTHDIPSIKRAFKEMRMADLQGRGLSQWVLKQTTSAPTCHWHIARLFGVLRQVEHHWDITIPWTDMRKCHLQLSELGYIAPAGERDRRVSNVELTAIKSKLSPRTRCGAADIFDFCLATAMRISEVCRIRWADFDENARTVMIRDRKHPRKKFGNHQLVPLLGGSFEIVRRQPRDDERIFPRQKIYISKLFHRAAVDAGITDMVLHDLRHEGISRLFERGFQIQEVALVSGHRDWKLLRRYTHLRPASLVEKERQLLAA